MPEENTNKHLLYKYVCFCHEITYTYYRYMTTMSVLFVLKT